MAGLTRELPGAVTDHLRTLETALANRDPRGLPGGLGPLIDDDFVEFGASGRRWTAAETRRLLEADPPRQQVMIEDLEAREVAPGIVLVTYRSGPERPALRSSLWIERGGGWSLVFHQGTPDPSP